MPCIRSKSHFLQDFPQKKLRKRNFRARLPSKFESRRYETEAFVRHILQMPTIKMRSEIFMRNFLQNLKIVNRKTKLLFEIANSKYRNKISYEISLKHLQYQVLKIKSKVYNYIAGPIRP